MKKLVMAAISMAILSTSVFANSSTTRLLLRELQHSNQTLVRVSAIETLKGFLTSSNVEQALLRPIQNTRENRLVRMAAIKALSSKAQSSNISKAIVRAHDQSGDTQFRAVCLQALYKAAKTSNKIKRGLIANLLNAPAVEIRRASAFGLMAATDNKNVRDALANIAVNPRNDIRHRIESIKSLYSRSTDARLRSLIQGIAENNRDFLEVRVAAVRFMTTFPQGSRSRNILERIIEIGDNPSVRAMAARSISFKLRENDIRWFHLMTDPRGNFERDPFVGARPFNFSKANSSLANGGGLNF